MYTLLRKGDRLPTVGVLQVLLNRGLAGAPLAKDGVFGTNTKSAVQAFQRPRGLRPDGVVGERSWPRLAAGTGFTIIDAIDITDPSVQETEGDDLIFTGARPTMVGHMCNGIGQVMQHLTARMSSTAHVVLLRFYGHGSPAGMGISDGAGSVRIGNRRVYLEDEDMSALTPGTVAAGESILRQLTPYFGRYSSVELHGCRVAMGAQGRRLVQDLADIWGVPVSAATRTQYAGGSATFRFEGPVHTAFAGGHNLRSWSRGLADMVQVSVP